MSSPSTIAIVGNPNCGKTTLFNQLTGSRQKVGNWPGVTVDKKMGAFRHKNHTINIVDLPGTYSLTVVSDTCSLDEKIACEYILSNQADLIINILDGANLKRNLYLTMQLLEMQVPMIVAVNMLDIAKQHNIHLDLKALSRELGCPVIALVSNKGQGIKQLKDAVVDYRQKQKPKHPGFSALIENAVQQLIPNIAQANLSLPISQFRWLAIRLLEQDILAQQLIANTDIMQQTQQLIQHIEQQQHEDSDIIIADNRYQYITELTQHCVRYEKPKRKTATQMIDAVVMNRWLGIPIFLLIMYLMFEFSMNLGTLLQPLFDISSAAIFINGIGYLGHQLGLPAWFTAIFAQGIGLGINTVVNFIPQIGLLFLFLSFLEDSGYMARAAFVMDRFMQWVGLPGKSFVPLIVGFGCNVPSIMATRSLDSRRDRIVTSLMSPFMSCGARLAIFVVFASAFFPQHGNAIIFLLYVIGILVAMLTGLLLKKTVLRSDAAPFMMELPIYHVPYIKNIAILTWQRLKRFLFRAGKFIVPICVLIGSLNAITLNGSVHPYGSRDSLLSNFGRMLTPALAPMGVKQDNWPATVGLITGTLAKEVVVGTLNTLYTQQQKTHLKDYQQFDLGNQLTLAVTTTWDGLTHALSTNMINPFTANEADHQMTQSAMGNMALAFGSTAAALAYLLFVLLYIPCVSTIGTLAREIGRGWSWASTIWSIAIAYTIAVIFYQAATWFQHPFTASSWISSLLLIQIALFTLLSQVRDKNKRSVSHAVA